MSDDYESVEITPAKWQDYDLKNLPATYWVSRGRTHGVLDATLQVWAVKPDMIRCDDGDAFWIAPIEAMDSKTTLIGEWSLGDGYQNIHNAVPMTERECIRVGPEPKFEEKLAS